jgi:hypothetical protein
MSPLPCLPAELRNLIYDYVFERQIVEPDPGFLYSATQCCTPNALALLHVNRQLYAETLHLPYNNFFFTFCSSRAISTFFTARSDRRLAAIQHLELQCEIVWCLSFDYHEWRRDTFSVLQRVPALSSIDVLNRGNLRSEVSMRERLEKCAGYIHSWAPGVKISARDSRKE